MQKWDYDVTFTMLLTLLGKEMIKARQLLCKSENKSGQQEIPATIIVTSPQPYKQYQTKAYH